MVTCAGLLGTSQPQRRPRARRLARPQPVGAPSRPPRAAPLPPPEAAPRGEGDHTSSLGPTTKAAWPQPPPQPTLQFPPAPFPDGRRGVRHSTRRHQTRRVRPAVARAACHNDSGRHLGAVGLPYAHRTCAAGRLEGSRVLSRITTQTARTTSISAATRWSPVPDRNGVAGGLGIDARCLSKVRGRCPVRCTRSERSAGSRRSQRRRSQRFHLGRCRSRRGRSPANHLRRHRSRRRSRP